MKQSHQHARNAILGAIEWLNKQSKKNELIRTVGVTAYSTAIRANFLLKPPRIILNGPPKSGTHLLNDCVSLLPNIAHSGMVMQTKDFLVDVPADSDGPSDYTYGDPWEAFSCGVQPNIKRVTEVLNRCRDGAFVAAHAEYYPALAALLAELDFRHVHIRRDPRDVVVSLAFYIKRYTRHPLHIYFNQHLERDEERIMAGIRGIPGSTPYLPSIYHTFGAHLPWLTDPATLSIRYEDLVGPKGGSPSETQIETVMKLADFLDRPIGRPQALDIGRRMYREGGPTFRRGKAGDWANYFTDEHKRVFKEITGDLLIRLGYESDLDW